MQVTLFLLFSNWEKSIFTAERVSQPEGPPFFTAHALRLLAIFVLMLSQPTLQIASYCVLGHKYFLPYTGWNYCKIATIDLTPIPFLLSRPLLLSLVIPRNPSCFAPTSCNQPPTPRPATPKLIPEVVVVEAVEEVTPLLCVVGICSSPRKQSSYRHRGNESGGIVPPGRW